MQYSTFHTLHIGAAHVRTGLPCQDMCLSTGDERFSIAVVSDGHGSRRHFRSERGSKAACEVAAVRIREFLEKTEDWTNEDREAQIQNLKQVICLDWRAAILEDAKNNPWTPEEIEEQRNLLSEEQFALFESGETAAYAYGCTLCAAFAAEWGWGALQVGDGSVAVIEADGTYRWPMPESLINSGHRTASLCANDPMSDFRHVVEYGHPVGLMAYTDGIEKVYPDAGKEIVGLLHGSWKNERFGGENRLDRLTKLLGEITRRSKYGDDVSIAGIVDPNAEDAAPKVTQSMNMQELNALELQREELLTTIEYNRRRLREILRDAPGSDAEQQIRQILDRREANLKALTGTINDMRAKLGLEPIAMPEPQPEEAPEAYEVPEEPEAYPEGPGAEVLEPGEDPGEPEPGEAPGEESDDYFWEDGSESDGSTSTGRRWTPDELEADIRRRTTDDRDGVTPEELEMMLQELRRKRDRQMRRRTPVRREPSFRIVDPVSIQDEMRDFMQDMRDFIRNPFGKRH